MNRDRSFLTDGIIIKNVTVALNDNKKWWRMKSGLNSEDGKTLILKKWWWGDGGGTIMLIQTIQINYHLSERNILWLHFFWIYMIVNLTPLVLIDYLLSSLVVCRSHCVTMRNYSIQTIKQKIKQMTSGWALSAGSRHVSAFRRRPRRSASAQQQNICCATGKVEVHEYCIALVIPENGNITSSAWLMIYHPSLISIVCASVCASMCVCVSASV